MSRGGVARGVARGVTGIQFILVSLRFDYYNTSWSNEDWRCNLFISTSGNGWSFTFLCNCGQRQITWHSCESVVSSITPGLLLLLLVVVPGWLVVVVSRRLLLLLVVVVVPGTSRWRTGWCIWWWYQAMRSSRWMLSPSLQQRWG